MTEKVSKAKKFPSKANVVEGGPSRPPQHNKKHDFKEKGKFHNEMVQILKSKRKGVIVLFVAR